jgi:Protein of unknown function (DUF3305)
MAASYDGCGMSDRLPGDAGSAPAKIERVRLGVVFERRRVDHPWQQWRWMPIALIPGAADLIEPKLLRESDGWAWYHLATLTLELFPGETSDYRLNLSQKQPLVYVLWRSDADTPDDWPDAFHVTVCHSETQDYLDGGDVKAEGIPMPEAVRSLLGDYVRAYHVDVPFKKRQRTPLMRVQRTKDGYG